MKQWRRLTVLYGIVNAIAYCCLLPLWEGFDEGFHYGYVQLVSTTWRFPVAGQAGLTQEIWRSYELTPVSHYLQPLTKAPINFGDYFAMTAGERDNLRRNLRAIPITGRFQQRADKPNYEITQTPLPYLFMAMLDRLFSAWPLVSRVLWIRLVCAVVALLLLSHATLLLAAELALPEPFRAAALFCIFSAPMLYAVLCHICNDAFAVPMFGYMVWAAVRAGRTARARDWLIAGCITGIALLTKAYLLFIIPVPLGLLGWTLWRRRSSGAVAGLFFLGLGVIAAPWYIRNLVLYRNLSGTIQTTSNLDVAGVLRAVRSLPWSESIVYTAHSSLWTGNNSFVTFSSTTLNLLIAMLAAGAILYFVKARKSLTEWAVVAATALFCCGLVFIAVAFYISSKGEVIAPMPWYAQVLIAPALLLVFLGLSRAGAYGRAGVPILLLFATYFILSTYYVKLLPLYGGYGDKPRAALLWRWYWDNAAQRDEILGHTCMTNSSVLWFLVLVVTALPVVLAGGMLFIADEPGGIARAGRPDCLTDPG